MPSVILINLTGRKIFHGISMGVVFFLSLWNAESCFSQAISVNSGNWFSASTWLGGVIPVAGQDVVISAGDSVVVTGTTPIVNDIAITGILTIHSAASCALVTNGNITINGTVYNNGSLQLTVAGKIFTMNAGSFFYHNPRNNVTADETIFINGIENFDTTSTLVIQKWSNGSIPLTCPGRISSDLGNIILSAPIGWNQMGFFSTNRIKGKLTVTDGSILMDDGSLIASTSLNLKDVLITGNGNIVFQTGLNRPFYLTTGTFIDSSHSALSTIIMNGSYGNLNFTVNGDLYLSHTFSAILGTYNEPCNSPQINVSGNFSIAGGTIELIKQVDASPQINVSGTTSISGSPAKVNFIDGNTGSLTFNTGNLSISGGNSNWIFGGNNPSIPKSTGGATLNIAGDFTISGTSNTIFGNADTTFNKVRISVGRDFIMNGTGASFTGANTNGPFTFKAARNFTITSGKFTGQSSSINASTDSVITGVDFTFNSAAGSDYFRANNGGGTTFITTTGNFNILNSGTGPGEGVTGIYNNNGNLTFTAGGYFLQNNGQFSGIYNGGGNLTFNTNGILDVNGGVFKAINNSVSSVPGTISFATNAIDYDGGFFSVYYASNTSSATGTITVQNNCKVNFTSPSDQFSFAGLAFVSPNNNSLLLNLLIKGDLNIGGANGTFVSSHSEGNEIIVIGGNLNISNGSISFNSIQNSGYPNGHNVALTIGRNLSVSGGNTFLSAMLGTLILTDSGNVAITGGTLSVKGGDGSGTFNILGGYTQSSGTFYLHNSSNDGTSNSITLVVNSNDDGNGDFVQSGGIFNFENCSIAPPAANSTNVNHVLNIKSPNYSIGPGGSMTNAFAGTGNYFGILNFSHTGTMNFSRSSTHSVQQVKQVIVSGTVLDVVSGNLQLASFATPALDMLSIQNNATLVLRANQVYSNAAAANSGLLMYQGSRLKTQHPNGLYNNTTSAAISSAGNMNYFLDAKSTVEYNGTHNQVISGTGLGNATLFYHQYGNLEINFGGIPDSEFVYPTNNPTVNSVCIRSRLILTAGELNLDNDHDGSNGGGRILYVANDSVTGIVRTSGYIRSEISDGSGLVRWLMNSKTGAHVFPFGYNSSTYVPFTFNPSSGTSGEVTAGTYHSDPFNLPMPPTVTQVHDLLGGDNSSNTVDRYWYLNVSGTISSANLTFTASPAEFGSISNPKAQRWIVSTGGWELPQGTQSYFMNGTLAANIPRFANWWALAGNSSPLPVDLVHFSASCDQHRVNISWSTATEVHNDHFSIERSMNGYSYEVIGTVRGAGNSSVQNNYSFTDEHPVAGNAYYRLAQTDYDGVAKTYDPAMVQSCEDTKHLSVSIYQDENNIINLLIQSGNHESIVITVFDVTGKKLLQKNSSLVVGDNIIKLNMTEFSSGIYLLQISGDEDVLTKKFELNKR
ncbi:MAG: T9SS type A sorting domain-containing protein [Bacteroidetes bacterium]|nr:T9SS type A sorting domain-containing protein [Bacteroidota bacterium]